MARVRRDQNGARWRAVTRQVYRTESVCALCGQPVDKTLPRLDGQGRENRQSKSVDHKVPVSLGGDPLDRANCQLAHLGCNKDKGNGNSGPDRLITTRDW